MIRPLIGEQRLTSAEKQRRYRDKQREMRKRFLESVKAGTDIEVLRTRCAELEKENAELRQKLRRKRS
jgi:hypothetical protein